ncbi:MAG: hypothetical protein IJ257_02520 [Treponema sp.]|nr:hypothetical protein [Treponema sp.]
MKKISKLTAMLSVAALLFGGLFLSCSDSDDDDNNKDSQKTTSEPTNTPADTQGDTTQGASATAVWDFATQPNGFPTSDGAGDAVTDLAVPVTSGTGATLTATGRWKWNADHIQAQASSGKTVADAPTWTTTSGGKWLTFKLEAASKVTFEYAGAGAADDKRFVAIYAENGTAIFEAGKLDNTKATKEFASVPAGTYIIAMNGSSIYSIKCE